MNLNFLDYMVNELDEVNDDEFLCQFDIEEEVKNEIIVRLIYSEQNYECAE